MDADQHKSTESGGESAVTLEYLSRINPPAVARPGFWAFVIGICGGVLAFGCWCLIDYMEVKYGPRRAEDFYLVWLVPPVIVITWAAILFRNLEERRRVGLLMATVLGAAMLTIALILGGGPLFDAAVRGRM